MNTDINNKPHNKQKKINLKKRDGAKSKKNNNTIDTDLSKNQTRKPQLKFSCG